MAAMMILFLSICLYVFSIPVTGQFLIHSLEVKYQVPEMVKGDVIVMLGGGATSDTPDFEGKGQLSGFGANRLLTTARIYQKTKLPIIVSGGTVFKDTGNEAEIAKRQLISLGIPANKIYLENKSLNTSQNAAYTKEIMKTEGFYQPILVTSAFHMERAVLDFTKVGIHVLPYPTDYQTDLHLVVYPSKFVPGDFLDTRMALKEYLGILALRI
jgi:uncharacterized SAM-binding protein YcdF (DUF218 family)